MNSPSVILQQDQADCGIACLLSVIRFYGGDETLANLRFISGTDSTGTTLLGLYQAAVKLGFQAEGYKGDIQALKEQLGPLILHIVTENSLPHFIVCFGTLGQTGKAKFIVGDPAKGIVHLSESELERLWVSRACLRLQPGEQFKTLKSKNAEKRKWLINLLKDDISLLGTAAGIGISIAILGLLMAVFSQRLIDDIIPVRAYAKLYTGIFFVLVLLVGKEALSVLRQYFLISQARVFNTRIVNYFYSHLLKLPGVFFDTRKIGDLTARLNDTSRIQQVISKLAGHAVIDILISLITFIFLFVYSWKIGLICLMVLPVYFLIVKKYNPATVKGQRDIMSAYAASEANYISTLRGIAPIKNYNKSELFALINKSVYMKYQDTLFSLGRIQIKLSFVANSSGIFFLVGILLFASLQVFEGSLTTGELMALMGITSTLLPSVANLALISIPINEAAIAFDRMYEFTGMDTETDEVKGMDISLFEQLEAIDMSFRFPGKKPLLKSISFKVKKGEMVAIVGENGCGKTTLVQIIQRHSLPESGGIFVNGSLALTEVSLTSWRRVIGIAHQDIHIFTGTLLENIAFEDAGNKGQEVVLFLKEYGFFSFFDVLPQSVLTIVGDGGIKLSGGQKQMIAIARALYHEPQLLVLDEATSAMDRQSEQFVLETLGRLKSRMAILFITHRLHVLKSYCDRTYIMENGRITSAGNHEQLLRGRNLYSAYWADLV